MMRSLLHPDLAANLSLRKKAVTIEDLLQPSAWAHVVGDLREGDMIEAVAEDRSWYARFLVRHIEAPEVHLGLITETHFKPSKDRSAKVAA